MSHRLGRWSPLRVHLVTLGLAGAALLVLGRAQWFASDDFDFVAARGLLGEPRLGVLAPHNEHWSTLPILLWRALFSVVGLRTYRPYMVLLVLTALLAVHLGWRAAVRAGADPWVTTAVAGALALVGVGWENLLWAFQSAWLLSLALGTLAVLVAGRVGGPARRPDRLDIVGWLAATGALASSAIGIPLVAAAGLAALLARGARAALLTLTPPTALFLVWFLLVGRTGVGQTGRQLAGLPGFVVQGLTRGLGALVGGVLPGAAAGMALLVWVGVAVVRRRTARLAVPLALAAAAPLFLLLAGLGRAALDPGASSPRYLHVVAILLAPMLAVALSDAVALAPTHARVLPRVALGGLAALVAVVGVTTIAQRAARSAAVEQAWRARVVAAAELAATSPEAVVTDEITADLTVPDALRMRADGDLPAVEPSAERRDEARVLLGVGPIASGGGDRAPAELVGSARVRLAEGGGGCAEAVPTGVAPQVVLAVPPAGGFTLRAPSAGRIEVQSDLTGTPVTRPRPFVLVGGQRRAFAVAAPTRLVLTLTGPARICGLEAG